MKVRSAQPFWPQHNRIKVRYPRLGKDLTTDVLVVGAGITGAMTAYYLARAGMKTVLIDRGNIAAGSTAASTALLQFELDQHLADLMKKIGRKRAVRAYLICQEFFRKLERLLHTVGASTYRRRPSLYLASQPADVTVLRREAAIRQRYGLRSKFLSREGLRRRYGIDRPAALETSLAGEVDPYRLTHRLIHAAGRHLQTFRDTEVKSYQSEGDGVVVQCSRNIKIHATRIVFATGYEAQDILPNKIVKRTSTYAIASAPIPVSAWWRKRALIWETRRPYIYIRSTNDGRVMIGGEDEDFVDPIKRDKKITLKSKKLEQQFKKLFPEIPFITAYAWAGTFGETRDSLPYIGGHQQFPRAHFALCYGANGILFSIIAAEITVAAIRGKRHPDAEVFSFYRAERKNKQTR